MQIHDIVVSGTRHSPLKRRVEQALKNKKVTIRHLDQNRNSGLVYGHIALERERLKEIIKHIEQVQGATMVGIALGEKCHECG